MHYTRLLKRYGHPVAKNHTLTDDEVNAILEYFDYSNVIDAPVTANPFIMLYGLCLKDIEQYPNFIERYLELNKEEIEDFTEFINKRKQDALVDPGSDE